MARGINKRVRVNSVETVDGEEKDEEDKLSRS